MIANIEKVVPVSGLRKAAVLMVALGDQLSAEVIRHLDEDEIESIGREVARIQARDSNVAESILEEFYQMTLAHDYMLKGGIDYARKILINAFGAEPAKKMLDRLMKALKTLRQRADEKQWSPDWPQYNQHNQAAEGLLQQNDVQGAFREFCRAMLPLTRALHERRQKEEVFQPVWDKTR